MNMLHLNPMRDLESWLNYRPDRSSAKTSSASVSWRPSVDIIENEASFILVAELAGVPKDSINVQVEKDILKLSGERPIAYEDASKRRIERKYGEFRRTFALPDNVDIENIKAESSDGILTLTLPKSTISETKKRIEIH